jgi:hypothetical protein
MDMHRENWCAHTSGDLEPAEIQGVASELVPQERRRADKNGRDSEAEERTFDEYGLHDNSHGAPAHLWPLLDLFTLHRVLKEHYKAAVPQWVMFAPTMPNQV